MRLGALFLFSEISSRSAGTSSSVTRVTGYGPNDCLPKLFFPPLCILKVDGGDQFCELSVNSPSVLLSSHDVVRLPSDEILHRHEKDLPTVLRESMDLHTGEICCFESLMTAKDLQTVRLSN